MSVLRKITRHDEKGMTLVEIMVAMIILGIAISWLAPLMIIAMRSNRVGGDMTEATIMAQDKLEELRSSSYASMLANPAGQDTTGRIVRSWTITEEEEQDDLLRIVIDMNWLDDSGQEHEIQFVSLRARAQ